MKKTSQQYLNSEAHGYLMEAKACKLLLKDLERIRAKLRRHIEKEAAAKCFCAFGSGRKIPSFLT